MHRDDNPARTLARPLHDAISVSSNFESFFDNVTVGMCFAALDGRYVRANPRFCEILGYAESEICDRTSFDVTFPADRARSSEMAVRMLKRECSAVSWEKRFVRKDGSLVWANVSLALIEDAAGSPVRFGAIVEDITERKAAAERLERSESMLRIAGEMAHVGAWSLDFSHAERFEDAALWWSDEVCAIHEVAPGEVPPLDEGVSYYLPSERAQITAAVEECRRLGTPYDLELPMTTASGRRRWVRTIGQPSGHNESLVGAYQDVTERKQTEIELRRMNRALEMRSGCNELLIRADEEMAFLRDICRLVVDVGGYMMAWIGYARDDAAKTVEPVASAGQVDGYLSELKLSWSSELSAGNGVTGRTIRGGRMLRIDDVASEFPDSPWRGAALSRGYRSFVVLPLRVLDRVIGTLHLYAGEARRPPSQELALLQELADDVAFGIEHLRSKVEQRRIQDAVLKIATGVSFRANDEFFERLAGYMAEAVGADAAFIVRPMVKDPGRARTIGAVVDGLPWEHFSFDVAGTPYEDARGDAGFVVPAGLRARYPTCSFAQWTSADALVAWRLEGSAGRTLAVMFALFRSPLEDVAFAMSTMKIFVARATAELERLESDARIADQASWLDQARDAIVVCDMDGRVTFWNKSAERLYGLLDAETRGETLEDLALFDDPDRHRWAMSDVVASGFWNGEMVHRRSDGSIVRVERRWTAMRDESGEPRSILSIDTDITQRRAAESEIERLAFYDVLTDLPNRPLLIARLKAALAAPGRFGALLFIDLDNFKTLNDTLGHDMGDLLLQQVAIRLKTCVRASDTVARLGGDEFVVLLGDLGETADATSRGAQTVADHALGAFVKPYQLGDFEHACTPSIGITIFSDTDRSDDVLKQADLAMYQAKAAGRNTVRFFDPQMEAVVSARRELENDIRNAFRDNQFTIAYQPQVDADGNAIGAEALLRWQHPERGAISPAEFIPFAEDSGLIVPIGRWVLATACAQLVAWSTDPELSRLAVSVNVSAREFRHVDFVRQVLTILRDSGADPKRLLLELTESVVVDDIEAVIAKMETLRAIGVGFSLDDFGTGYSSLSYLKRLPLDQLKIDQSFVRDVLVDANDAVIARTIVGLGRSLSVDVIAEGVETQAQHDFLAESGCRQFQGYFSEGPVRPRCSKSWSRTGDCASLSRYRNGLVSFS